MAYGKELMAQGTSLIERIGRKKVSFAKEMIDKDINSPLSSSAGRLFDAVASITGICDVAGHEAEGAVKLEKAAKNGIKDHYNFDIRGEEIDVLPAIRGIADDMKKGLDVPVISAKFHNTVVELIFEASRKVFSREGMRKVLFSGGCFQNRYLLDHLEKRFRDTGFEIYTHKNYSTTDVNVSIGQAVVAAGLVK
jgi:hydrogenase maturation protein HypF